MNVHNSIGSGFQGIIYHNALKIEFTHQHILHRGEVEIQIFYRGVQVGTRIRLKNLPAILRMPSILFILVHHRISITFPFLKITLPV
jgi:hypothetical protein